MHTKYCVVAMRGDLGEFLQMIDFASVPDEKIGSMNSANVMVATFISNFSVFELNDLFQSVKEVNFFLMEIDRSGIFIEKEDVRNSLMSVFEDFDQRKLDDEKTKNLIPLEIRLTQKTPEEIERDFPRINQEVEEEYTPKLKKMSPKEKKNMLDEILDRMPKISSRDKALLTVISKYL